MTKTQKDWNSVAKNMMFDQKVFKLKLDIF